MPPSDLPSEAFRSAFLVFGGAASGHAERPKFYAALKVVRSNHNACLGLGVFYRVKHLQLLCEGLCRTIDTNNADKATLARVCQPWILSFPFADEAA